MFALLYRPQHGVKAEDALKLIIFGVRKTYEHRNSKCKTNEETKEIIAGQLLLIGRHVKNDFSHVELIVQVMIGDGQCLTLLVYTAKCILQTRRQPCTGFSENYSQQTTCIFPPLGQPTRFRYRRLNNFFYLFPVKSINDMTPFGHLYVQKEKIIIKAGTLFLPLHTEKVTLVAPGYSYEL